MKTRPIKLAFHTMTARIRRWRYSRDVLTSRLTPPCIHDAELVWLLYRRPEPRQVIRQIVRSYSAALLHPATPTAHIFVQDLDVENLILCTMMLIGNQTLINYPVPASATLISLWLPSRHRMAPRASKGCSEGSSCR